MSWQAVKAVVNGPRAIKGSDLTILIILAEWADEKGVVVGRDGGKVRIEDIEDQSRCKERTVQLSIKWLSEQGYLIVARGGGAGIESAYRLDLAALDAARTKEEASQNGAKITPFNRKKGADFAPLPTKKGANITPFPIQNGADFAPYQGQKGAESAPFQHGIYEHDFNHDNDDSNQRSHVEKEVAATDGSGRPYSPYIASVITDYSNELGDSSHTLSNVSQALRIWERSGIEESLFVEQLHAARKQVRTYQGKQGLGTINNKMAYFFRTLRNAVGDLGSVSARGAPVGKGSTED